MKQDIKANECSNFSKRSFEGDVFRLDWTIDNFHLVQERVLLVISRHKFAFVIKRHVCIVLVAAISWAMFINAVITLFYVSHIDHKVHIVGLGQAAEAV